MQTDLNATNVTVANKRDKDVKIRDIDLADVQQILGHDDPSTTMIYAQVSEERKKQAHKKYHVQ